MQSESKSPERFHIWEGCYSSFALALADAVGPGFEGNVYSERSLAAISECLEALEEGRPIPPFHKQRSTLLPISVAMMLGREGDVHVLDFGGGLGIGYLTLSESIPNDLHRVKYTIVEGPEVAGLGARTLGKRVTYLSSIPTSGQFSLVHAASSLQYIENWKSLIAQLARLQAGYILLSDVFAGNIKSFATLQNYYGSRIPHWFLNLDELNAVFSANGYTLRMKAYATSRRLGVDDILPMENFPEACRLKQTLHLLFERAP